MTMDRAEAVPAGDAPLAGALPGESAAPGWRVEVVVGADGPLPVLPSILSLIDGNMAVIGDVDPNAVGPAGFVLVSGAYGAGGDDMVRLLTGPGWTFLGPAIDAAPHRWVLDLHSGILVGEPVVERGGATVVAGTRTVRFVSLARPGIGVLRAERLAPTRWADALSRPAGSRVPGADHRWDAGTTGRPRRTWAETTSDRSTVTVAAEQRTWTVGTRRRIERVVAVRAGTTSLLDEADAALSAAHAVGVDELLQEHRDAWGERWSNADIEIRGDPDAQLAVRFALFHLLSCAPVGGEAPVGARGLTGLAYAGHVFWDTDVFVLPTLAATLPEAARAVLEYRIRRLPAARAAAADRGLPGARFAWESADTGSDVTPRSVRDVEGRVVPILTGEHAEHINSDVAWAALHYVDWTGDESLLRGEGRALVIETAEYLAARVRTDTAGRRHLDGVIGPDEYHEVVDDNAYTNGMARWHLRRAAQLLAATEGTDDAHRLAGIADTLVDGFDPVSRRHEQFAGFWELEPLPMSDLAEPPVAADVLLGRDRVARSQVIKQPDVMMLHHLLPDDCPPGARAADLDYYLPLTAHGSSLSPAICAAVLAREGRPDDAMRWFDLAARLDLDDLTGTTAGGLHLATMGGLWQAVVHGFAGIRPRPDGLHIDPCLPTRWTSLRLRLAFRGDPVTVTVDHDSVDVDADRLVPVVVAGHLMTAPFHQPISHLGGHHARSGP
jgi:trehalose/maltose hydrolase-like predicted phosphorylase